MKEELNKVIDKINLLDKLNFRGQVECIRDIKNLAHKDTNQFTELIHKNEKWNKCMIRILYLALYEKGYEKLKDDKGKPVGTGLFYSKLPEAKKKEFIECANKVLEIFGGEVI